MNELIKIIISKFQATLIFYKKNKIRIICAFASVTFFIAGFLYISLSSKGRSKLVFSFESGLMDSVNGVSVSSTEALPVLALNRAAKSAKITGSRPVYAYFVFSEDQQKLIKAAVVDMSDSDGSCFNLTVVLKKLPVAKINKIKTSANQQAFSFGYLYEDDFFNGKLKK